MDNEEKLHKELDLIQGCITRMANNSFMIKGWTLTLFVALITFFNLKELSDVLLIFALIVVVFIFAYLDSFYLWQERKYVRLYSDIIEKRLNNNFSNLYNLSTKDFDCETIFDVLTNKRYKMEYLKKYPKYKVRAWLSAQKRNTIGIFYGVLLIFIIIYSIFFVFCSINKNIEQKQIYEISIKENNIDINKLEKYVSKVTSNFNDMSKKIIDNQEEILRIEEQLKNITTKIDNLSYILKTEDKENKKE